ncbi:MAG: hypothetical protein CBC38_03505 [Gammaproteobacteria bacterium TMED78]|nr:MAG: hypothetical protein CBC38_03505 [Gammaproteobacteria bacterium TMED78]|tara:strand:+ start:4829 stop:5869 length:1041 start_codon:yes stop_codon:yes gene_type:complete
MNHSKYLITIILSFYLGSVIAQETPSFEFDASFPKPLPEGWINAQVGGVCVDSNNNITIVDRRNITEEEEETTIPAPPIMRFNQDGDLIHSFGDPDVVPAGIHACYYDNDDNIWVAGNRDSVAQKYSYEGDLLMQIGTKGVYDTSTGVREGEPLNSSQELLNRPSAVVTDPENGDIYISDGYGNRRVVVFDENGNYLRQWGEQSEVDYEVGEPGTFAWTVHCITMNNNGEIYVCDRYGDRVQVFNKMGEYIKSFYIGTETHSRGTAWDVEFSPDDEQTFMYVINGGWEKIEILNHETGETLSTFGRPGHQAGAFTHAHTIAVDHDGNIYIAETSSGRRVQRFKLVN